MNEVKSTLEEIKRDYGMSRSAILAVVDQVWPSPCVCNPSHRDDDPVCRFVPGAEETETVQVTAKQIEDVIMLSRSQAHAVGSAIAFLQSRGLIAADACVYSFAHTREWCGNPKCRES